MLLVFEFQSEIPLYMQLRNQIVIAIAQGRLVSGERLPTIRTLAEESGVNMMTISKAYQLLKKEGYILTDRRSGAVVAPQKQKPIPESILRDLKLVLSELQVHGVSEKDALSLCQNLYREGKEHD